MLGDKAVILSAAKNLEQGRMAVGKLGEDSLHGGFPEYGRTGLYSETVAVLLDCGHFAVIEVDNLAMAAAERLPALLENLRIDSRSLFLLSGQNLSDLNVLVV